MHSQRAARRRGRGIGDQHSLVVGNAAAGDVGKAVDRGRSGYEIYRPLLGQRRAGRYGPYRGQGSGAGIVQLHVLTGGEVRQCGLTLIMHSEGNPIGNVADLGDCVGAGLKQQVPYFAGQGGDRYAVPELLDRADGIQLQRPVEACEVHVGVDVDGGRKRRRSVIDAPEDQGLRAGSSSSGANGFDLPQECVRQR